MKTRNAHGQFIKGHKHTDEAIEKNRQAHLGKPLTPKHKRKSQEILRKYRIEHGSWNKGRAKAKACKQCSKEFTGKNAKFCSKACAGRFLRKGFEGHCHQCRKPVYWKPGRMPKRLFFCSKECRQKAKNNPYNLKVAHGHPNAYAWGTVLEHRLVVEQVIGYYLPREWQIHHINCDKKDNRPENLYIFKSRMEHQAFHKNPYSIESNLHQFSALQEAGVPVVTHP